MAKKVLTTPISAEDLEDIHVGDVIYLTGKLTTCRDVAHRRVIEEGRDLPVDVKDGAILHAGPIIRPLGEDQYEMVTVGPTTSMRMEKFEEEFIKKTGVRLIIGKGGMGEGTMRGCRDHKALHCVFPAPPRSRARTADAAPSSPRPASRKFSRPTGKTSACRKRSGPARSKSSVL